MIQSIKRFFSIAHKQSKYQWLNSLETSDIEYFQTFLKEEEILKSDLSKYNNDWMGKYHGESSLVLLPNSTEKISKILKHCNSRSIPVVPQGGNTGLVGGSVPLHDEIIISLARMNKILSFDSESDVVSVESGVILEAMNQYLQGFQVEAPYDLGAKGSCLVGGNVATHAGGKYLVKHGPLKGYVLGLEVVLANGEVLDLRNKSRKDNTGIDLKQIFIGSEGSLGIITKIDLLCARISPYKQLIFLKTTGYSEIQKLHERARNALGRSLAAVEWMDSYAFGAVISQMKGLQSPFKGENSIGKDYYLLLEVNCQHDIDGLLNSLFDSFSDIQDVIMESVLSESDQQYDSLWKLRETVGPACGKLGKVFKYDISLHVNEMDSLTQTIRQKCKDIAYTVGYGHIGDGNLHVNVACLQKKDEEKLEKILEPYVFEVIAGQQGSISAEHGLGLMKAQYLHLQKKQNTIDTMVSIKKLFDPKGILNPYKILPGV